MARQRSVCEEKIRHTFTYPITNYRVKFALNRNFMKLGITIMQEVEHENTLY